MVNRRRESTFGGGAGTAEAAPLAPATAKMEQLVPNGAGIGSRAVDVD